MTSHGSAARLWIRLLVLHRPFQAGLLAATGLTVGTAGLALLIPLIYRFIIDTLILNQPAQLPGWLQSQLQAIGGRAYLIHHFWVMGLVLIVLISLEGLFNFLRGTAMSRVAEGGARQLRKQLFSHIQALPYAYHSRVETGDLIQRCTSDVDTVRRFFDMQLQEIVRSLALVVSAIVLMAALDIRMMLVALAGSPLIFILSVRYFKIETKAFTAWEEAEGALSTQLQESMTGIRVVKAFARQAYETRRFAARNEALRNHGRKTFDIIANFWMLSDWINLLQILAVTVTGALFVIAGTLSLGLLVVFISYTELLLNPLRNLARMLADAGKAQIAFGRVQKVLQEEPEPPDDDLAEVSLAGRIDFQAVDFAYGPAQRLILHNLSFSVEPGQTVGILGPTGSGKSTIFYLLQRLYEPTAGVIRLDDINIRTIRRDCVRRQVGLILQEPFVFSRTVRENIRLPRPEADDRAVVAAARAAALHDDINQFSAGYDTMIGERGVTLSGGQKQRLAIARTLIRDCPVILFDDSLSAVDTETDAEIRLALQERRQRATTLIISHRISTLAEADWILVLENGQVTARGTHGALISQPGLYQRVWQIQNELQDQLETISDDLNCPPGEGQYPGPGADQGDGPGAEPCTGPDTGREVTR